MHTHRFFAITLDSIFFAYNWLSFISSFLLRLIFTTTHFLFSTVFFFFHFNLQSVGWDVPHGHSLQARCKDLGLYKLLGETRVLCSNGLWAPRMPSCVPTTLLTNFSGNFIFVFTMLVSSFFFFHVTSFHIHFVSCSVGHSFARNLFLSLSVCLCTVWKSLRHTADNETEFRII